MKKFVAELIGTFMLVFIETVSGAHLNPAVSIAMFVNKRL